MRPIQMRPSPERPARRAAPLALAAALALTACAGTAPQDRTFAGAGDPNLLLPSGGTWAITAVNGTPAPQGARLTRRGAQAGGSDGCATLSGGFATSGARLDLPGLARSGAAGAACGGAPDAVLAALQAADGVSAVSDGTLQLTAAGRPVLTMVRAFDSRPGEASRLDAPAVTARP